MIMNVMLLLFIAAAEAIPCYNSTISLDKLFQTSYNTTIFHVRLGVYSKRASTLYNIGLRSVASECACENYNDRFEKSCLSKYFVGKNFHLKSLKKIIRKDRNKSQPNKIFPLYNRDKRLPAMTSAQKNNVENHLKDLVDTHNTTKLLEKKAGFIQIPSDELLFEDEKSQQEAACDRLRQYLTHDSRNYSSLMLMAYGFAVFQKIRYTGADPEPIFQVLRQQTRITFDAVRCYRKTGENLRVPAFMMDVLFQTGEEIIKQNVGLQGPHLNMFLDNTEIRSNNNSEYSSSHPANNTNLPELADIASQLALAFGSFRQIIEELNSFESNGQIESYLLYQNNGFVRESVKKHILRCSLFLYRLKEEKVSDDRGNSSLNPEIECAKGWTYMYRFGVLHRYMMCCFSGCLQLSSIFSNILIDSNICCDECNMYSCNGGAKYASETIISEDTKPEIGSIPIPIVLRATQSKNRI